MRYYKKLVGEKCFLSPIHPEDAGLWAYWLNDLEISLPLGGEASETIAGGQIQEQIVDWIRKGGHVFDIVTLDNESPIGRCLLFGVNLIDRTAMAGIFIGDKGKWGRGFGLDAMKLLLDYGFNLLNLNSIMLGVLEFNERALACYQKLGFREIGRRRQGRIIAGHWYDVILMDLLAEEFHPAYVNRVVQRVTVPRPTQTTKKPKQSCDAADGNKGAP